MNHGLVFASLCDERHSLDVDVYALTDLYDAYDAASSSATVKQVPSITILSHSTTD